MTEPQRLGRRHAPDPRDGHFLLAQHPRALAVAKVVSKTWAFFSKPLDQGNTGTCVGHGWKHRLMAAPMVRKAGDKPSAFDIYDRAILVDEWTDNDNDVDRQMGTSVRAGAKVLQGMGLLDEYAWITSADEAAKWIGGQDEKGAFIGGPIVIGVNWYDGMFDTDQDGILRVTGQVAGGHCVCLNRWIPSRGLFGGIQNWALPWGIHGSGHFFLRAEDLDRLLREDGEGCTPTESRMRLERATG
jgi:hypothetical protein